MNLRRNILIFHSGALGDFIVTWPLAMALARVHPQSRVFYVTQRGKAALSERVLRLESADADQGWHAMYSAGAELAEPQARLLAGAHSVVTFLSSPGDAFSRNLERLSPGANYLTMTVSPPSDFAGNVSDHLLAQLQSWPAAHEAMVQVLRSVQARGILGRPPEGNAVLIHPGSGSPRKCWPVERFAQLIEQLRAEGREVRVVVGEVEQETWAPRELQRLTAAAEPLKPGSYIELLDELMKARAFVGNDSGPSHLAGIIGLPTVSVFGPSNANHWRPLGPRVRVVQAPSLDQIDVEQVHRALISE